MHGHGTGELLDFCVEHFPPETEEEVDPDIIKVAVCRQAECRQKSSLLNKILGHERVIVSNVARDERRDAIDTYWQANRAATCSIDTAGMRRKSKVDDAIERYSNMRSIQAIDRCDVCLILIDANEGDRQSRIQRSRAWPMRRARRASSSANKWDTVEKENKDDGRENRPPSAGHLGFMTHAPVLFTLRPRRGSG